MSENRDSGRTRRRARRTVGPPPAYSTTANEDTTEKLDIGSAKSASAPESGATEKIRTGSGSAGANAGVAKPATDTDSDTTRVDEPTPNNDADTVRADTSAADSDADTARMGWSVEETAPAGDVGASPEPGAGEAADATVSLKKPGTTESDADPAAGSGRSWKRIVLGAAAAVLVVGLVAAAVVSVLAVQSTQQRDERRAEYVATARQTVLNLTTIRADTAEQDIDRILTSASGDFKTEFDGRIDPFTEIVKQAEVASTGEVVEAAVERDDENSGVVLVAAKQTLTNAGAEEEQQRFYRFRVTVTRGEDGKLTASNVDFVA